MYIKYSPQKHKDRQLYEFQTEKIAGIYGVVIRKSTTTHEIAKQIPWYFVVEE